MRHLYLHVPFCVRRCSYCDFSIAVRKRIPAREYVEAVLREVELLRRTDPGRQPGDIEERGLDTLYLGGGTPSLLPPDALAMLVTSLRDAFGATSSRDASSVTSLGSAVTPSRDVFEVTLEANPEDVTPAHATAWRRAGVNRVSLGAQSFDDHVLAWMHRSHDAARIGGAVRTLRDAGFDNLSLDLIFALPAELQRDWERDLELALSLGPDHLSLYGLTVEERTPLARWISRGAVVAPEDDRYAEEYAGARAACGSRLSFLRGLERLSRRLPLPPQLGVLVWSRLRRARSRGPQLRWPRAALEYRGVAGIRAGHRRRPLPGRVRGDPHARATGTGAPVPRVTHRCRTAGDRPRQPATALDHPMDRAWLGGGERRTVGLHAPGVAPPRCSRRRLDQHRRDGLNC